MRNNAGAFKTIVVFLSVVGSIIAVVAVVGAPKKSRPHATNYESPLAACSETLTHGEICQVRSWCDSTIKGNVRSRTQESEVLKFIGGEQAIEGTDQGQSRSVSLGKSNQTRQEIFTQIECPDPSKSFCKTEKKNCQVPEPWAGDFESLTDCAQVEQPACIMMINNGCRATETMHRGALVDGSTGPISEPLNRQLRLCEGARQQAQAAAAKQLSANVQYQQFTVNECGGSIRRTIARWNIRRRLLGEMSVRTGFAPACPCTPGELGIDISAAGGNARSTYAVSAYWAPNDYCYERCSIHTAVYAGESLIGEADGGSPLLVAAECAKEYLIKVSSGPIEPAGAAYCSQTKEQRFQVDCSSTLRTLKFAH